MYAARGRQQRHCQYHRALLAFTLGELHDPIKSLGLTWKGAVSASHHPPPPHLVVPRGQPHPAVARGRIERCYRGVYVPIILSSFFSKKGVGCENLDPINCEEI